MTRTIRNCTMALLFVGCLGCPTRPAHYSLAVYLTGSGTVALNPPGGVYESGANVTLTPNPAAGWHFDHWEGAATGSANPLTLAINANTSITAVFATDVPTYDLKISTFGKGAVTLDPPGGTYTAGTTVTLTPTPGENWEFSHWFGGISGSANPASLIVAGDTEVTAAFRNEEGLVMQLGYGQLMRMAASPDGELVLTGSLDGVVRVWDTDTGVVEQSIYEYIPVPVNAVAFSPDGSQFLTSSLGGGAELWDTPGTAGKAPTKLVFRRRVDMATIVRSAAFSPFGVNGLFGCDGGELVEVNLLTGDLVEAYGSHAGGVAAVAYSNDGGRLASASYDDTARVYLVGVPVRLREFSHPADVYAIAFLPDGDHVITGCQDGNVRICNVLTGGMTVLAGHTDSVLSVAVSPDGTKAISGSMDHTAILWDAITHADIYTLTGHQFAIPSVCFAAGGDEIFTADRETITQWDAATGTEITTLYGHTRTVNCAEFSTDGSEVVTAGDYTAHVYVAATGERLQSFYGHTDTLKSVAFSPDASLIVTGSFDETIRIWNVATGELERSIDAGTPVHAVDFSPDGTHVLAGLRDNTARTWDVETGAAGVTCTGHTGWVTAVAYSYDGAFIATGSHDDTAMLWNAASGGWIRTFPAFGNDVRAVEFSTTGTRLLAGSYGGAWKVFETATGLQLWGLPPTMFLMVYDVAFSPDLDASSVLTANAIGGHLWDADGLDLLASFLHFGQVFTVDYAPDGLSVLTGGDDGSTRIWQVE
ncbi:MAG TPA: hypothetical protein VMZ06_04205 [Candidatus Bathyarchaeia archaeon]|nr:hypothetical protein [Candidatus Bathyarchaeia archaeon]